jgi:peptidoglycan/LPS O-acetylase OafA/YrhL
MGADSVAPVPSRFHSLDVLRGLAALAVVHTHWYIFFAGTEGIWRAGCEPFHGLLAPLYREGWRAVDLFFCLSGFVFCWLYAERIAAHRVGAREFAVLRFSRLYPLHLATLLFVAAAQSVFLWRTGAFFAVPLNDAYHFVLNLLFLSGLGFEKGGSFNGPVWSVSVECFLYLVFYVACRLGWRRWWHFAFFVLAGVGLEFTRFAAVGRGLTGFFIGAIVFYSFSAIRARGWRIPPIALVLSAVASWAIVAVNLRHPLLLHAATAVLGPDPTIFGWRIAHALSHPVFLWLPFQVLPFPCTILALALWETARGTLGRRWAFLGDISYSSYLLHFPLQLIFVSAAIALGFPRSVFLSPVAYVLYFSALIAASLASYHWLERPTQRYLRSRLHPTR